MGFFTLFFFFFYPVLRSAPLQQPPGNRLSWSPLSIFRRSASLDEVGEFFRYVDFSRLNHLPAPFLFD